MSAADLEASLRFVAPDGGWGWVVVFASFMVTMISDGISFSYGILNRDLERQFGKSKSLTSLVGSLLLSMPELTGPIASALTDRYGCRKMTIISGLIAATGFILGSLAQKLEHLLIAFSITGIGLSSSYVTSVVIVAYYFNKKRSLATGLAACGSGIGTFILAPLTTFLLKEYTWRGTLLIMSGFFLNIVVFGALMRDINIDGDGDDSSLSSSSDDNSSSDCEATSLNMDSTIAIKSGYSVSIYGNLSAPSENDAINHPNHLESNQNLMQRQQLQNKDPKSICGAPSSASSKLLDHLCSNYNNNAKDKLSKNVPHHEGSSNGNQTPNLRAQLSFDPFHPVPYPENCMPLRNYSSLVNIPTYIHSDGIVFSDILKEISIQKVGDLSKLLQQHPDLFSMLCAKDYRNAFLSSALLDTPNVSRRSENQADCYEDDCINELETTNVKLLKESKCSKQFIDREAKKWKHRSHHQNAAHNMARKCDFFRYKGLYPRTSLTYRTILHNRRSRLRASSAPDIYHNSVNTITQSNKSLGFMHDIKRVLRDLIDISIFSNFRFSLFCLSNLLLHGCIDVIYVYLPDHAISSGCTEEVGSYLISVMGIANTLGTIIVGYIGDKTWLRPATWYSGLTVLGGIAMAIMPLFPDPYILGILTAFYGISVSANFTLVSVILVEIISLDKFTNAYGLLLLVQGIASMVGPPFAGWLFDVSGSYHSTFYVIGLLVIFSGALVLPMRNSGDSINGSSINETPNRRPSPMDDKIRSVNFEKPFFDKKTMP